MEEEKNTVTEQTANEKPGSAQEGTKSEAETKTFTQADIDKIVSERLKRESEKWEQKLTESQKLAKMNAEQKAQYEREQAEKKLAEREADITRRELQATAKEALIEKGLPVELFETLNYTDAEACTKSIEAVQKAFKMAVEKAVDNRIKQSASTPKTGTGDAVSGVEAAFYKLNPNLKK